MRARPPNTRSSNTKTKRKASRSGKLKSAGARRTRKAKQKNPARDNAQKGASKSTDKNAGIPAAPWTYKPEFAHIAQVMCETGASVDDLAHAFNIDIMTINKWQRINTDFRYGCEIGSARALAEVERTLMQRARGYDYTVVKIFRRKRHLIVRHYKKHVPANVKASMFLLTNCCPEKWSRNPEPPKTQPEQQAPKENELSTLFREINEMHAENNRR